MTNPVTTENLQVNLMIEHLYQVVGKLITAFKINNNGSVNYIS